MPLVVELRDYSSNVLGGAGETTPSKRLPDIAGDDFPLLRGVDEYGVTVFNSLQMTWILQEFDRLRETEGSPDQARLLDEIVGLGRQCAARPHTYLVFLGIDLRNAWFDEPYNCPLQSATGFAGGVERTFR